VERARRDGPPSPAEPNLSAAATHVSAAAPIEEAVVPRPAADDQASTPAGAMRPRSAGSAADRARAGVRAAADRGRAVVPSADGFRRGRTELLSAAVLVLALLSAVVAYGGLDLTRAAADTSGGAPVGLEGN
jgi:hypothetical protein